MNEYIPTSRRNVGRQRQDGWTTPMEQWERLNGLCPVADDGGGSGGGGGGRKKTIVA